MHPADDHSPPTLLHPASHMRGIALTCRARDDRGGLVHARPSTFKILSPSCSLMFHVEQSSIHLPLETQSTAKAAFRTIFRATSLVLPHLSRDNRPTFRQTLSRARPPWLSPSISPLQSRSPKKSRFSGSRSVLASMSTQVEWKLNSAI